MLWVAESVAIGSTQGRPAVDRQVEALALL